MPILEISHDELGPRRGRATLAYIESVMLWPNDSHQRDRAAAAVAAQRITNAIPDDDETDEVFLRPAQLRELLGFAAEAPRLSDLREESQKALYHGIATGLTLAGVLHRRDTGHPRAQVGAVMELVAKRLAGVGDFKLTVKTMNNAVWPRYRSVAHLWAAYVQAALVNRDPIFPCRLDRLADFLHVAEWFRAEGEGWRPKQSDRPVLDTAESWRLQKG